MYALAYVQGKKADSNLKSRKRTGNYSIPAKFCSEFATIWMDIDISPPSFVRFNGFARQRLAQLVLWRNKWLRLRLEQFAVIAEDLKTCFASA